MNKIIFFFIAFLFTSPCLFAHDIIAMKSSTKIEAGGALPTLVVGLIIVIIAGILKALKSGYKKIDSKVDELKLDRNPNNLKVLEKEFFRNLKKGFSNYKTIIERIQTIDKDNVIPNSVNGILLYENSQLEKCKPYLKSVYNAVENNAIGLMNRRHFNNADFAFFTKEYIGKAIYYYGHLVSMEGKTEEANKIKKRARRYNSSIHHENLY